MRKHGSVHAVHWRFRFLQLWLISQTKDLLNANQTLREALAFAQVEGYQRVFLQEGEALLPVLRAVMADEREEPLLIYVRSLLAALTQQEVKQITSHRTSSAMLIEPLSPQEQRVLRLLAAGRSNPEIAQELIVSVNTVKTQGAEHLPQAEREESLGSA